jgi:hypothetical protein
MPPGHAPAPPLAAGDCAMTGTAAEDWGLFVNECAIFASGIAADRWAGFLLRVSGGRLTMLSMSAGGGEYHVMCGTRDAAREAREIFTGAGFHKSHVTVTRLAACQEKARRRGRPGAADHAASLAVQGAR